MPMSFPSLDHLTLSDAENVYEPSDDTFLLCDVLTNEEEFLKALRPLVVMEIGCGSGCVTSHLNTLLSSWSIDAVTFAIDINKAAIALSQRTFEANQNKVDACLTDLGGNFRDGSVDVLVFNPPYVPTPSEEVPSLYNSNNNSSSSSSASKDIGIEASWAGGVDGREVIDRFLPIMQRLLRSGGCCYLLLVQENKPEQLRQLLLEKWQMTADSLLLRQARNEHLLVLRIVKP